MCYGTLSVRLRCFLACTPSPRFPCRRRAANRRSCFYAMGGHGPEIVQHPIRRRHIIISVRLKYQPSTLAGSIRHSSRSSKNSEICETSAGRRYAARLRPCSNKATFAGIPITVSFFGDGGQRREGGNVLAAGLACIIGGPVLRARGVTPPLSECLLSAKANVDRLVLGYEFSE